MNAENGTPEMEFLRRAGLIEPGSDRERAFELFWRLDRHFTPEQFHHILKQSGMDFTLDDITLMLRDLEEHGLARELHIEGEETHRFEPLHLNEHHDHLICIVCGKITEFHDPALERVQNQAVRGQGFLPFRHNLQVFGVCPDCAGRLANTLPLSDAAVGEFVQIEFCGGGKQCAAHLAAMGLREGEIVEILSSRPNGPVIVLADGCRVGVGAEAAAAMIVRPITRREAEEARHGKTRPLEQGRRGCRRRHRRGPR